MNKKCERCKNKFDSIPIIQGDNVCNTCNLMNCITFWCPRLKFLEFPTPKTIIVHTNHIEDLISGERSKGVDKFLLNLIDAAIETNVVENGKVFLRTGYLSNKHDWEKSCLIKKDDLKSENRNKLFSHVYNLVEMSQVATIGRLMPIDFWAVREFIETEPYFNYFSGNMPITKERRFFVKNGKIVCHHNYWDRKAFKNNIDEEKFNSLAELSKEDESVLTKMALYVAKVFHGYWSADFLKSKNGEWFLTDMAIGESSYHQEHYPPR